MKEIIAEKLKTYRKENNVPQHTMATRLKISLRNYCRIEKAEIVTNLETICDICRELGVKTSEVLDEL